MKREILFRGKRIDTGEWVEGDLHRHAGRTYIGSEYIDGIGIMNYSNHTVHPDTVGQFTGLLDKNGKKVFEGDVIRVDCSGVAGSFEDGIYNVKYFLPDCAFCLEQTDEQHAIQFNECYDYEIIGTIHDDK